MQKQLNRFIKYIFNGVGYEVSTVEHFNSLTENSKALKRIRNDLSFLKTIDTEYIAAALNYLDKSKSQLRQDLFVLSELDFKHGGYFVEFGATDGIKFSNTHLLEREFGWHGILAEPARLWHQRLRENRTAHLELSCIWKETGCELEFQEVSGGIGGELSTIAKFSGRDQHAKSRQNSIVYPVDAISLNDLLAKHKAPREIDYLSIDTEGSELEILSEFDFDSYDISVITCEHNFTSDRSEIHSLLTSNGFVRKYETISKFDDWYVAT